MVAIETEDGGGTARGFQVAEQAADEGGFPCAVGAEESEDTILIDGEVAMVKCVEVVVAFGELLGLQDRGHGWPVIG